MTPSRLFTPLVAACLLASLPAARADFGTDQTSLAAAGRYDELQTLVEQARAKGPLPTRDLHALCFAYSKVKRYAKLFDCLDTLEKQVKAGDRRTRLFGHEDATPAIHLMRAEALLELGRYEESLAESDKALTWYKAEDSDETDLLINGLSLSAMAAALSGKEVRAAQLTGELAAVPAGSVFGGDYKTVHTYALARAYMAQKQYDRTYELLSSDTRFRIDAFLDNLVSGALFAGRSNWVWQELPRAFMINKSLMEMGRPQEAKAGYDRLLALPQLAANGEIHWMVLFDRGRIAEEENQPEEAIRFYQRAIDVIELQRANIHTEASKIGFVGDKQAVYGRLVVLLNQAGRTAQAFEFAERARSRALVDMLATRRTLGGGTSQAALATFTAETEAQEAQVPLSAEQAGERRSAVIQSKARLRQAAPELASLVTVDTSSLQDLRKLLAPDETLVQYYRFDKHLYVFLVSQTELSQVELEAPDLQAAITSYREAIDEGKDVTAQSQALYRLVFAPLAAKIRTPNLLIVSEGALHYLPFAALHDGKQALIDRFGIRYLPSASVLRYLKSESRRQVADMLILGNPDLGNPKLDLPSAQQEAETLAKRFPGAQLLVRGAATKGAFREHAPRHAYLHIASHGKFDARQPLQSALYLAGPNPETGRLTVGELYDLQLNADLVTLSACETGLGKVANGDDVIGLTRGFLYAGARSIVASLWEVDDEATSKLMQAFYQHMAQGKSKRDALRQAQLEVRKEYPPAMYWAAFYLTGTPQ